MAIHPCLCLSLATHGFGSTTALSTSGLPRHLHHQLEYDTTPPHCHLDCYHSPLPTALNPPLYVRRTPKTPNTTVCHMARSPWTGPKHEFWPNTSTTPSCLCQPSPLVVSGLGTTCQPDPARQRGDTEKHSGPTRWHAVHLAQQSFFLATPGPTVGVYKLEL